MAKLPIDELRDRYDDLVRRIMNELKHAIADLIKQKENIMKQRRLTIIDIHEARKEMFKASREEFHADAEARGQQDFENKKRRIEELDKELERLLETELQAEGRVYRSHVYYQNAISVTIGNLNSLWNYIHQNSGVTTGLGRVFRPNKGRRRHLPVEAIYNRISELYVSIIKREEEEELNEEHFLLFKVKVENEADGILDQLEAVTGVRRGVRRPRAVRVISKLSSARKRLQQVPKAVGAGVGAVRSAGRISAGAVGKAQQTLNKLRSLPLGKLAGAVNILKRRQQGQPVAPEKVVEAEQIVAQAEAVAGHIPEVAADAIQAEQVLTAEGTPPIAADKSRIREIVNIARSLPGRAGRGIGGAIGRLPNPVPSLKNWASNASGTAKRLRDKIRRKGDTTPEQGEAAAAEVSGPEVETRVNILLQVAQSIRNFNPRKSEKLVGLATKIKELKDRIFANLGRLRIPGLSKKQAEEIAAEVDADATAAAEAAGEAEAELSRLGQLKEWIGNRMPDIDLKGKVSAIKGKVAGAGATVGGVAATVAAKVRGDKIIEAVKAAYSGVAGAAGNVWGALGNWWSGLSNAAGNLANAAKSKADLSGLIDAVKSFGGNSLKATNTGIGFLIGNAQKVLKMPHVDIKAKERISALANELGKLQTAIGNAIGRLRPGLPREQIKGIADFIVENSKKAAEIAKALWEELSKVRGTVAGGVARGARAAGGGVAKGAKGAVAGAAKGVGGLARKVLRR